MSDIFKLVPPIVGAGVTLEPDAILEAAKGKYTEVVVIGFDAAGELHLCATHDSREALWALKLAEHHLLHETGE